MLQPKIAGLKRQENKLWLQVKDADDSDALKIVLLRCGSITHCFNADQRLIELSSRGKSGRFIAEIPADRSIAPPEPYWLFAVKSVSSSPFEGGGWLPAEGYPILVS